MEFVKIQKMGGIKCDNPNCTYRNESVDIGDYPNWINKPCPLCGANLLTKEDYQAFQNILKTINIINKAGNLLPSFIQKKIESSKKTVGTIGFDGTGKPIISEKKDV